MYMYTRYIKFESIARRKPDPRSWPLSPRSRYLSKEIHTFALECGRRCREQQLVPHRWRLHTSRYTCLHVILFHPFGQPSHAAVAVERVGPKSAVNTRTYRIGELSTVSGKQCVRFREGVLTGGL